MNTKFYFVLFFIYAAGNYSLAQSKKDIEKNKIKSITEFNRTIENGIPGVIYKSSYSEFDKKGKKIGEIEFNKDGSVKRKEICKYDTNDNIIEEANFEEAVNTNSKKYSELLKGTDIKKTFKYNVNNDKTEENEFDGKGKLIKKQLFFYNNKGERYLEESYDWQNKLIKRVTYTYDNKGLKTEKKIFSKDNVLEMTKKYLYEF